MSFSLHLDHAVRSNVDVVMQDYGLGLLPCPRCASRASPACPVNDQQRRPAVLLQPWPKTPSAISSASFNIGRWLQGRMLLRVLGSWRECAVHRRERYGGLFDESDSTTDGSLTCAH
jgi:hypothetical protein